MEQKHLKLGDKVIEVTIIEEDDRGNTTDLVLKSDWCGCGNETFGCYPHDGECECGVYKHHVHCGNCGCISQVG